MIWALIILIMIDNNYDHMIRAWSGSRAAASSQGGEKGSLSSPRFCQHLRHLRHLCHFRQSHHCSLPLVTDLVTDPMTDPMNSPMTNHFCLQLHVFAIFAVIAIIITITIYSNSYWIAGWGSTRYHPAHKLSTLSPMSNYCPSQFVRISILKDCIRCHKKSSSSCSEYGTLLFTLSLVLVSEVTLSIFLHIYQRNSLDINTCVGI